MPEATKSHCTQVSVPKSFSFADLCALTLAVPLVLLGIPVFAVECVLILPALT